MDNLTLPPPNVDTLVTDNISGLYQYHISVCDSGLGTSWPQFGWQIRFITHLDRLPYS